jgi:anti-sigma-K factor RskA
MSAQDHGRWQDELAAYVLGSLDPAESEEMERHLESCAECRERLLWLRPAAELLPESVESREPPPQLRERLMAEVRADAARRREVASGGGRRPRGWLSRPAIAIATVALLAAGVAGYELGTGGGGGTTTITGPEAKSGALASLERNGDSGTLQVSGLSQLPASEVYQAWVQRGGRMEPSSLFAARMDGTATAAIPRHLDGAQAVAVTVEPRGGSRRPTSPPLVSVPLAG